MAADAFDTLPYDRWRGALPLGDGAAAAVLTRTDALSADAPGSRTIVSAATYGDPTLELSFPGHDPFAAPPDPLPVIEPAETYATISGVRRCVQRALEAALEDAGLNAADPRIARVTATRSGRALIRQLVVAALPAPLRPKFVPLAAKTGHLGASDLLANLAELPTPPDNGYELSFSLGAGFTTTCLITQHKAADHQCTSPSD